MKSILLCCGFAALAVTATAAADPEPVPIGPPIVVTADRIQLSADPAVAPVIVIDRDAIERSQATDVAQLLQFVAGVDVAQNGGPGQPASVFIRGANSDQTLVLLDGVPINPGTLGGASLQNIAISDIQRIEIVKGPRSSLYGSGAIGGAINIVTRTPHAGVHAGGSIGAGRYGTRKATADVSAGGAHFDGAAGISRELTDGFPPAIGSTLDRGYGNTTLNLFGGWHAGRLGAAVHHWQSSGHTDYLDFDLSPLAETYDDRLTSTTLTAAPTSNWRTQLEVSHFLDAINQVVTPDYERTRRNAGDWQNSFQFSDWNRLVAGVHFAHEDTASLSFGTQFAEAHNTRAIYAQDDAVSGPHHVVVAARDTQDDRFGNHLTGNLDYGYQLTLSTRLTAGFGTAFHAPTSVERFGFGGNPNLDPETSRETEVGLRQQIGADQQLTLDAYRNDIDNLIVFVDPDGFLGPQPGRNENVARSRIRGVDIGYAFSGSAWNWQAHASFSDPRDLASDDYLARRARRSFTSTLSYALGPHTLSLNLLAVGPRKDSPFSTVTDAGYVLVNLNGRFQLTPHWVLFASIDNAFDTDYQVVAGFRTPGRGVYLTLQYTLDHG